jgi:hypothetical protein
MSRFHGVYDKLHQALDVIPYDELGISVEVQEQVIPLLSFPFYFYFCFFSHVYFGVL